MPANPNIIFIARNGAARAVVGRVGQTLLQVAHQHRLDLEGACDHSLACATCHVVVARNWYDSLPPPHKNEQDMLDLAVGLTKTSRLACQITLRDVDDGLTVTLPAKAK